jgi:hypothetical protein
VDGGRVESKVGSCVSRNFPPLHVSQSQAVVEVLWWWWRRPSLFVVMVVLALWRQVGRQDRGG